LVDNKCDYESGKFLDVTEYLTTIIKSKQKILLFSSFVKHIELYIKWCKNNKIDFSLLTGETSIAERETKVNEFQNNPNISLFFISLKAGGVGLNLTAASYVILLDPWWNPFAENQAIARAHRIGQKQNVTVVRFITKDSVEEKILLLQKRKLEIAESIIDIDNLPSEIEQNLDYILS
jgi:non-specific serine/threonine protein kinase